MSLKKEVMLCVHSTLLPSIVQPSDMTDCFLPSISSSAWKTRRQAIPPTISSEPARTPFASRVAVAGFTDADLSIEAKENTLTIRGEKQTNDEETTGQLLYRGIAARNFERSFQLADHVEVMRCELENGLLHVELVREIPEVMKPRVIPIMSSHKALEVKPTKLAA